MGLAKNSLHRGAKALIDSGEVNSEREALAILERFRLVIVAGPDLATSSVLQAALLTAVNAGSRCLLGGVTVVGCPDARCQVSFPGPDSLHEAITHWGGRLAANPEPNVPVVLIGTTAIPLSSLTQGAPVIRATFDGWTGAVTPDGGQDRLRERGIVTPSGILAGALAVSEAFQYWRGKNVTAFRRRVALSLWRPEIRDPWGDPGGVGPEELYLPEKVWLIGLGHLGQAYLWTLTGLPYEDPTLLGVTLQDHDVIQPSNWSTSLLTKRTDAGRKKTRLLAELCEERGIQTVISERRFGDNFRVGPEEPGLALCGVDNVAARRALEYPGFLEVIEAGLGHEREEYLDFRVHTFPASRKACDIWRDGENPPSLPLHQPAYQQLLQAGENPCGITDVAGAQVAIPFVGAAVSALVIAEAIRAVMNVHRYEQLDGSLLDLRRRSTHPSGARRQPIPLGYLRARE